MDVTSDVTDLDRLFDAPSRWRAQAARSLGLSDEELLAGVSPGASCPAVLRSVLAGLRRTEPFGSDAEIFADESAPRLDLVIDVGAGVGGISEWFRRRTGGAVVAVEPSEAARHAAAMLFPALRVRAGSAEFTGLAAGVADAALLIGVISLIDDAVEVLREAERIVRPGGAVAIADLFSANSGALRSGPNLFRSVEQVITMLAVRGWTIVEVGVGTTASDASWTAAGALVDEWIRVHRNGHPAFPTWDADQAHLRRHIDQGDLLAGCVVARHRPTNRSFTSTAGSLAAGLPVRTSAHLDGIGA
jgi:SAM-dependent methyltransferase